jgi:hypothetical protein
MQENCTEKKREVATRAAGTRQHLKDIDAEAVAIHHGQFFPSTTFHPSKAHRLNLILPINLTEHL